MKKQEGELPVTAAKIARMIKRSSGAVASLRRLEKAGEVSLTNKKPREYSLAGSTK